MTQRRWIGLGFVLGALVIAGLHSPLAKGQSSNPEKPEPVKLGMVSSLFADVPPFMVNILGGPFNQLMKEFTGLDGKLALGGDVYEVARKLNDKELDVAVFHAVEFGWAQQKYPALQPMMLAVNNHRLVRASLVVKEDTGITCFADLKGKVICLPRMSKLHCKLFLEHGCTECGQEGPRVTATNIEDALDNVFFGKVQAVVTDTNGLEHYEGVQPGRLNKMKVIRQSDLVPGAVVAYRKGALDDETLKKFKNGMINANKSERGRDLMSQWKMTGFEPVGDDFAPALAELLKTYAPPPEAKAAQK